MLIKSFAIEIHLPSFLALDQSFKSTKSNYYDKAKFEPMLQLERSHDGINVDETIRHFTTAGAGAAAGAGASGRITPQRIF
jgi:hypothetical protein